jgi:hypothetical protein
MKQAGVDESYDAIMKGSVTTNLAAFHNAWSNLMTSIAGPNSTTATAVLQSLAGVFSSMTLSGLIQRPYPLSAKVSPLSVLHLSLGACWR